MKIDKQNIPSHIAIIMDGNRRWARGKGFADIKGHEAGAETLEKVVDEARAKVLEYTDQARKLIPKITRDTKYQKILEELTEYLVERSK